MQWRGVPAYPLAGGRAPKPPVWVAGPLKLRSPARTTTRHSQSVFQEVFTAMNHSPARHTAPLRFFRSYLRHAFSNYTHREGIFTLVLLVAGTVLFLLPTGFENPIHQASQRVRVQVLSVDDSGLGQYGVIKQGEQLVQARILDGPFQGQTMEAVNIVYGKMEMDKVFVPGDTALAVLDPAADGQSVAHLTLMDHWRIDHELWMVGIFFALLLLYGGWTGIKTFTAFGFTAVAVWKLLIPLFLAGVPPVPAALGVITLLTVVIIGMVGGLNKVGLSAMLGCLAGVGASSLIALVFAGPYHLNGAVRPFSETLLYAGYVNLDLNQLFLAGTFLASSGAIMDLAIDVAAAMGEVFHKRPELGRRELISSGFRVGRTVFGTMTTTLLLAYTGGFASLFMVFMAQGIPLVNLFNMGYISSEIFHTMAGSFGLVLVAPFTAILAACIFTRKWTCHGPGQDRVAPDSGHIDQQTID